MNLGDLNETVTILYPTVAGLDAVGGEVIVWSTLDTWQVNVQPLSGAERLGVSDAPTNVDGYRVTGRNRDDLTVQMRIRWGALTMEIASVPPAPRAMFRSVECRAITVQPPAPIVDDTWIQGDWV
jgi:head-tail adaptor